MSTDQKTEREVKRDQKMSHRIDNALEVLNEADGLKQSILLQKQKTIKKQSTIKKPKEVTIKVDEPMEDEEKKSEKDSN